MLIEAKEVIILCPCFERRFFHHFWKSPVNVAFLNHLHKVCIDSARVLFRFNIFKAVPFPIPLSIVKHKQCKSQTLRLEKIKYLLSTPHSLNVLCFLLPGM